MPIETTKFRGTTHLRALAETHADHVHTAGQLLAAANEIDDLRTSVIAFGAPWAVKYAEEWGLPPKHLDPRHYDILKRAGARMDDFIRGSAENAG